MVTVLLSGGLGNQMFQYAAAKALAKRLDTHLFFDLYNLTKKTKMTARSYELDIFNIDVSCKSTIKGKILIKGRPFIQKHRVAFQHLGFLTDTYALLYEPVFRSIKGNITMSGYFQSERYFENIRAEIQNDFEFKVQLDDKNKDIANQIINTQSVAIHIRRGDYITDKNANQNFAVCDAEYYRNAISYIKEKIPQPSFYIFSEDMEWAKNNIDFGDYPSSYINWNKGKDSYRDMQLMSLCRHNVIANSSFSWWAAWLNKNVDKIVVAPSIWFKDEDKNKLLDDFYPSRWTKI